MDLRKITSQFDDMSEYDLQELSRKAACAAEEARLRRDYQAAVAHAHEWNSSGAPSTYPGWTFSAWWCKDCKAEKIVAAGYEIISYKGRRISTQDLGVK